MTTIVRLTNKEQSSLSWDDLANRPFPKPECVKRGKLWSHYRATSDEWGILADYADGQAEHWESGGTDNPDSWNDGRRCRKVAARIRRSISVDE